MKAHSRNHLSISHNLERPGTRGRRRAHSRPDAPESKKEKSMRQVVNCGGAALVLAAALLSPADSRASTAPFLMVAQQHHAVKDGKKGVIFHVTADVSDL